MNVSEFLVSRLYSRTENHRIPYMKQHAHALVLFPENISDWLLVLCCLCGNAHVYKTTKVVNSVQLLGGSGGVVSFLDFCPASLTSIGYFYFRWVLSSQWKAVTVNLRICEFYTANFKDILEARSQNVFGNTQ